MIKTKLSIFGVLAVFLVGLSGVSAVSDATYVALLPDGNITVIHVENNTVDDPEYEEVNFSMSGLFSEWAHMWGEGYVIPKNDSIVTDFPVNYFRMDSDFQYKKFYFDGGLQFEIPVADQDDFPIQVFRIEQDYMDGLFNMDSYIELKNEQDGDWPFNYIKMDQHVKTKEVYVNISANNVTVDYSNPPIVLELDGYFTDDLFYLKGHMVELNWSGPFEDPMNPINLSNFKDEIFSDIFGNLNEEIANTTNANLQANLTALNTTLTYMVEHNVHSFNISEFVSNTNITRDICINITNMSYVRTAGENLVNAYILAEDVNTDSAVISFIMSLINLELNDFHINSTLKYTNQGEDQYENMNIVINVTGINATRTSIKGLIDAALATMKTEMSGEQPQEVIDVAENLVLGIKSMTDTQIEQYLLLNATDDRMYINHTGRTYNLSMIYKNFPDGLKDIKQIPEAHHLLFLMEKNDTAITFDFGMIDNFTDDGYRRLLRMPNIFIDAIATQDQNASEWLTKLGEIEFYNLDFDFEKTTVKGKDAFAFEGDVNINKMKTLITEMLFEATGESIYVHDIGLKMLATSNDTHGTEVVQIKLLVQGLTTKTSSGDWLFNVSKFCEVFDADPNEVIIIVPDYIESDYLPLGTTWTNGTSIDYTKGSVDLLSDTDGITYSVDSNALEEYLEIQAKIEELKNTLMELQQQINEAEKAGQSTLTFQNQTKTLEQWREEIRQSERDLDQAEEYLYSNDPENAALFYNKARDGASAAGLIVPDELDLSEDEESSMMLFLAIIVGIIVLAGIASMAGKRKKQKSIDDRYDDDLYSRIKIDQ